MRRGPLRRKWNLATHPFFADDDDVKSVCVRVWSGAMLARHWLVARGCDTDPVNDAGSDGSPTSDGQNLEFVKRFPPFKKESIFAAKNRINVSESAELPALFLAPSNKFICSNTTIYIYIYIYIPMGGPEVFNQYRSINKSHSCLLMILDFLTILSVKGAP